MTTLAESLALRPESEELALLVTLDSGATVSLDRRGRWIHYSDEGGQRPFSSAAAVAFAEVVEQSRDAFEEALIAGARAAALPGDEVVASFPALELIRALLATNYAYLARLALLWIRPSELRELRPEIIAVTLTPQMPGPVKDLARRLTVPEGEG